MKMWLRDYQLYYQTIKSRDKSQLLGFTYLTQTQIGIWYFLCKYQNHEDTFVPCCAESKLDTLALVH